MMITKRQAFNVITMLCLVFVVVDAVKDVMLHDWAALARFGLVAVIILMLSFAGVFKRFDAWLDKEDD